MGKRIFVQVEVEPELKERFNTMVFARTGNKKGLSDAIRSFMVRELTKWEESQRDKRRKEEEHQANISKMRRKTARQAS